VLDKSSATVVVYSTYFYRWDHLASATHEERLHRGLYDSLADNILMTKGRGSPATVSRRNEAKGAMGGGTRELVHLCYEWQRWVNTCKLHEEV
jgi:hypothetical protein